MKRKEKLGEIKTIFVGTGAEFNENSKWSACHSLVKVGGSEVVNE